MTQQKRIEEQLRQSSRMEVGGRLAGDVGHDFNNLLTTIQLSTEVVQHELADDDPRQMALEQILKSCRQAGKLTRRLLLFSQHGAAPPEVIRLNGVVSGLRDSLVRLIGENIELSIALVGDVGSVRINTGKLEQVLLNLVLNARDAMPTGGRLSITTSIASGMADPEGAIGFVSLSVTDTGRGMDAGTITHIFEPFFTTKQDHGGLGLTSAFGIVREAGGRIEVESKPDEGTRMTILLPHVADPPSASSLRESSDASPHRGTETALRIEDEDGLREMATEILELAGYRVSRRLDRQDRTA